MESRSRRERSMLSFFSCKKTGCQSSATGQSFVRMKIGNWAWANCHSPFESSTPQTSQKEKLVTCHFLARKRFSGPDVQRKFVSRSPKFRIRAFIDELLSADDIMRVGFQCVSQGLGVCNGTAVRVHPFCRLRTRVLGEGGLNGA